MAAGTRDVRAASVPPRRDIAGTPAGRPARREREGRKEDPSLCQPDAVKSCGACCGLYNHADSSRDALRLRLRRRTERFRLLVRRREDLPLFSGVTLLCEDQAKRFEVIHCCEYLGFLDARERRVGCLLHPSQRGGEDLRDVSFYGRDLCAGHFCPSHQHLTRPEKEALVLLLDDWFLYGLCVTDIDYVKTFFRFVSEGLGGMPAPEIFRLPDPRRAARRFFSLKETWPFRSPAVNRFGKYHFDGSRYMIRPVDYDALGVSPSRFDALLLSLASEFSVRADLLRAERILQTRIDKTIRACRDA